MRSSQSQRPGRPLLFLGMVVLGWTGLRIALGSLDITDPPGLTSVAAQQEAGENSEPAGVNEVAIDRDSPPAELAALELAQEAAQEGQMSLPEEPTQPMQLDAPPPAHLVADPIPLPAASTHNSLWMSASQAEPVLSDESTYEAPPKEGGN